MNQGIEFLFDCAASDDGEAPTDVIHSGGRSVPRWLSAASIVAVMVLAGAVLAHVARSGGYLHVVRSLGRSDTAPVVAGYDGLGPRSEVYSTITDAEAVVAGPGHQLEVVRVGSLTALNAATGRVTASTPVPELTSPAVASRYRLVTDGTDGTDSRLWLVEEGSSSEAHVIEFDARTLRRVDSTVIASGVQAAAVLGGDLYLATSNGVASLDSGLASLPVPGTAGFIADIAADAPRGRLLIIDGPELIAERPDGRDRVTRTEPAPDGRIVVAGDAIWIATRRSDNEDGPTIDRLDSTTLAPLRSAPDVRTAVGAGTPEFVASSARSVWLRDTGNVSPLICMNATTGAIGEYFSQAPGVLTQAPIAVSARATLFLSTNGAISAIEPASGCA